MNRRNPLMKHHIKAPLWIWMAVLLILCQISLAHAESAARVSFLRGAATVTDATAGVRDLRRGDTVKAGDIVETGPKAVAQIVFPDQSVMYVKADSKIKLEAYRFESGGEDRDNVSVTEVLKGGMRSITGLIGQHNPDNVKYKSGDTTIGIRGTAVEVDYDSDRVSMITFDYGHGFVEAERQGFCIRKALTHGDTMIISGNETQITDTDRSDEDASQMARRLVLARPDETINLAKTAGQTMPLEDSLLTLAMLREVSQFNSGALSAIVEGMSSSINAADQEVLVRNAAMIYPSDAPVILEAATRGNMDIGLAVSGVMCGLRDQPSDLTDNVIHKAVELGITPAQAREVLGALQGKGCA